MEETMGRKGPEECDGSLEMILDTLPLATTYWSSPTELKFCNQLALDMFGVSSIQEFIDSFDTLSPEFQPNGKRSTVMIREVNEKAFAQGSAKFEWTHQQIDGGQIPSEVTLVRMCHHGENVLISYTQDLRKIKKILAEKHEADERARIMLDATPLCCNFWDENMNNIDCNQEAVRLFELTNKQEYLDRFFELSPEYQPDGRLSEEKAAEMIHEAFRKGRVVFEWMHQKLDGEPVPAEITLVRVKQGDTYIVAGYTRDLRELKKTVARLDQLETLAFTDSGTGVYNRRYFMTRAERAFEMNDPDEGPLAIIMMDLDKFKDINDTYGHLAGDEVLKAVAVATQGVLRPSDLLARYGGEEFIIMIKQSRPGVAEMLAERIRSRIADLAIPYDDKLIAITVSLGIALREGDNQTVKEVINQADAHMYHAKQHGRNRVGTA